MSQSLDSDPRLQGYAIKGYGPWITSGNRFAVTTIQSLAPTVPSYSLILYQYLLVYPRTDITGYYILFQHQYFLQNCTGYLTIVIPTSSTDEHKRTQQYNQRNRTNMGPNTRQEAILDIERVSEV